MAGREFFTPKLQAESETVPFASAEEGWFWFVQAQQAREEGARFMAGAGLYPRPCEPVDILKILDRLYRGRVITWDHVLVLKHYGRRLMPPDPDRVRERRAYLLWVEALGQMEMAMVAKGIVAMPLSYQEAAE